MVGAVDALGVDASTYKDGELTAKGRAEVERLTEAMETEMRRAAKELDYERAAAIRDELREVRGKLLAEGEDVAIVRRAEAAAGGERRLTVRRAVRERGPVDADTAGDWLVGIADEHPDDEADEAAVKPVMAKKRATWDPSITPNVIGRKGKRPSTRSRR